MPLYDFRCRQCGETFEEFAPPVQTAPCPACGSNDVERVLTGFAGPFTVAPRGVAARRSNAQRRVREDPLAVARMRAREAELRTKVYGRERAELYGGAPLAIKREVGELIHALTLARAPALAVEFGASVGLSTIYLAAALRDLGEGR